MNSTESTQIEEQQFHYVLPLSDVVIFPKTRTKILVNREIGEDLIREMHDPDSPCPIGLTIKSTTDPPELSDETLYKTGNLLDIAHIQPTEGGFLLCAEAIGKVQAGTIIERDGQWYATCIRMPDNDDLDEMLHTQMLETIKETIRDISTNFQGSDRFTGQLEKMQTVDQIIGFTMPFIPVPVEEKQAVLEMISVRTRAYAFLEILLKVKENIDFQVEMTRKVTEKVSKTNREAMLREQLRVIQEELDEMDGGGTSDKGYRERITESEMPDEVKKKALSEAKKLETNGGQSHENPVIRNYLDLLLDLPWSSGEKQHIDIAATRTILNEHHYGLERVKERIIQHLAVMKLKSEKQGSILLLVGPPGTGKTSLGKSIATALGRSYIRVSLGGMKDESEIRGHRRTYVGALPGRIIQGMKRAGTKNPVFVLDEIDKLAYSHAGDPASALLEVLDPEQNTNFSDHYLEVPYDLSEVLFIATANSLATIPAPLLDRMELIEIPGYTKHEIFSIGKEHLLPKTISEHGLDHERIVVEDDVLTQIIDTYTWEAGVRGLKKQLDRIARYVSEKIVTGTGDLPYIVRAEMLPDILGKERYRHERARTTLQPGVATGLAWTPAGGDILFIEGTFMPGTGKLTLTGQLGEVMKESANISMSLIRSRFAYTAHSFDFMARDVHIHVPSGATPKDGPSAGITLFTALVSLITGKEVDPGVAMTGEITLSGSVLPVGGIREKVLAAHRAGIKRVILPQENEPDLEEIPDDVRSELTFILVRTIEEVLKETLNIDLPPVLRHHEKILVREICS